MTSTAIVFDHYRRATSTKEASIDIRITHARRAYYISTGVRVKKNEWMKTTAKVVNRDDAEELNERIRKIRLKIERAVNDSIENEVPISPARIKREAWMEDKSATYFYDWLCDQIPMLGHREGTRTHYTPLQYRLKDFGRMMSWHELTTENICMFDAWLHNLTKPQSDADIKAKVPAERISDAAVYNYHKCLKALLNRAVLFNRIYANPYDRLRGKFKRGDRENTEYLTDEEMRAFMSISPVKGSQMEVAKDLFVVQMYTGLGYSDLQAFDMRDYKKSEGVWVNVGRRVKTGVAYVSQLLPPVVEVLEKYGMAVPKMGNADYNHCLKALGMAAGIEKPLHSHLARHTFATFMLRNGVPIEHVSKMLGHTNITQTQRYAKVLAQDVRDDFTRISNILTNKKSN